MRTRQQRIDAHTLGVSLKDKNHLPVSYHEFKDNQHFLIVFVVREMPSQIGANQRRWLWNQVNLLLLRGLEAHV